MALVTGGYAAAMAWTGSAVAAPARVAPLRLVAIGDSTVEGLEDPRGDGTYRGWADRLAEHLAVVHPELQYANLAVRGQTAGDVRATQLDAAVALEPDIAVVVAGMNDVLRPTFAFAAVRAHLLALHGGLAAAGARVVSFTMPDMARVAPAAVLLRRRLRALNAIVEEAATMFGSTVVDLAAVPVAGDPRLWHDDRLHGNAEGHRRVALALAAALGLDVEDWSVPLPRVRGPSRTALLLREARWARDHVVPWAWDGVRRVPVTEVHVCKRPDLRPL